ncbi:MAG: hypothetical protein LBU19_05280 [Treponema sp.]|jgi:hypothetical protein|nr:hypothetical protein [Treponema sp.]
MELNILHNPADICSTMNRKTPTTFFALLFCFFPVLLGAQNASPGNAGTEPSAASGLSFLPAMQTEKKTVPRFPALYFTDYIAALTGQQDSRPYWASPQDEASDGETDYSSILLNNDIVAFYGHPSSRNMGILGRHSIEELDAMLTKVAAEYAASNGGRGVRRAFYIIFGTVWPKGEIGIINKELLTKWIEYALEQDILIFIDHQIGRYDPVDSLKVMLPWLRYSNVHLALDPEWRTEKPMQEIGRVTADELNRAQETMEQYIRENNIPGERLLVVHQFNYRMIANREKVRSDFERVRLVHCADGFGPPRIKRDTYAFNAQARNIPIKGFKLFYESGIPGAGYDQPLLSPSEVFTLNPRPYVIMYQ